MFERLLGERLKEVDKYVSEGQLREMKVSTEEMRKRFSQLEHNPFR